MDPVSYERFLTLKESGQKAQAKTALQAFIASFTKPDEKLEWTHWYFEHQPSGHKVRHELYEEIIFPILLLGYHKSDPWALRWLSRTTQNLYQAKHLWAQIDYKTDHALLKELISICPSDNEAKQELLTRTLEWFRHCSHEWPAGILYGSDGASPEQCKEIINEIQIAKQLDQDQRHSAFLTDLEAKVHSYVKKIT